MSAPTVCSCGNRFDGDNLCMVSACQWEGIERPEPDARDVEARQRENRIAMWKHEALDPERDEALSPLVHIIAALEKDCRAAGAAEARRETAESAARGVESAIEAHRAAGNRQAVATLAPLPGLIRSEVPHA